jgi:teichuronic acid exporter
MSADLKGQVVSSLRWQAAAKLGSQLISWGVTLFVMRLLAPADYGLMAMAMVLVGFSALVAEMGLGAALVRAPEADLGLQRRVFGLTLGINALLYGLLLALTPWMVWLFQEPRLAWLSVVLGLQLPLAALATVPDAMARRQLAFKPLSLIELGVQTGTALATLGAAFAGLGVWALVVGHVGGSLLRALLLALRFGGVMPSFQWRGQRELLGFGGSLTLNRAVWYFSGQADVFVAGRLLGQQLLGYYTVALNLATMPMQKLMQVANQVAYSAFAKLQHEPERRNEALLRSATLMSSLSVALLWGLAGSAPDLLPLLIGAQWQPAVLPLQIIAAVVPLRVVAALVSTALVACGHVGDDLRNTLIGAAVLVPAFLIGTYTGGLLGLCIAWAVGYPVYGLLLIHRACQRFGLSRRRLAAQLRVPVLAGAVLWLCLAAPRWLLPEWDAGWRLLLGTGLGGLAYLLVLRLLDASLLREARGFLRG